MTLVFIFSIISVGLIEMYFTGLPTFIMAKPLFSRDSKTSYVLLLGTPDISATSLAEATPLEKREPHLGLINVQVEVFFYLLNKFRLYYHDRVIKTFLFKSFGCIHYIVTTKEKNLKSYYSTKSLST